MSERSQFLRFFAGSFMRTVVFPLVVVGTLAFGIWYYAFRDDTPVATPTQDSGISQSNDDKKNKNNSGNSSDKSNDENKQNSQESEADDQPAASGNAGGQATTPSTPPSQSSQELANSGPGEVAAIFAAATIAGTILHRRYQLRKSA